MLTGANYLSVIVSGRIQLQRDSFHEVFPARGAGEGGTAVEAVCRDAHCCISMETGRSICSLTKGHQADIDEAYYQIDGR